MTILQKVLTLFLLVLITAGAATTQVNTYTNGNVLTADELNSEFGNLYSTINSIDNDNIASAANISPAKISSTIDGSGISRNGATGQLSANVDGTTVTIVADQLTIDDLPGDAIINGGVDTAQLADGAVTKAKLEIKTTGATATVGNVALSNSSGAGEIVLGTSSTGDLANNSVTLTTNGGPVMITMVPGTAATNSYIECEDATTDPCTFILDRSTTDIFQVQFVAEGGEAKYPPGAVTFLDTPSAGTYTYKIQYDVGGATALRVLDVRLMAYEL